MTGTRTVLDVLVEEHQLFTTQQQLVTAEHDAALAEFNIAAAAGRLIAPCSDCRFRSVTWAAITHSMKRALTNPVTSPRGANR